MVDDGGINSGGSMVANSEISWPFRVISWAFHDGNRGRFTLTALFPSMKRPLHPIYLERVHVSHD